MLTDRELFDESFYLGTYADVASAVTAGNFTNGYQHFQIHGQFEGRNPSALLDTPYYLQQYPDVAQAFFQSQIVPSQHFVTFGQFEGRNPRAVFDTPFYLASNPDVAQAVGRDLLTGVEHFVRFGQFEGRVPSVLFNQVYVFGDSLSDDGNGFIPTGGQLPPSPPYFQGRFSNGPVWIEQLIPRLGLNLTPETNVAFGGATSGTFNVNTERLPAGFPPLPGVQTQIDGYISAANVADPRSLYVVWAGSNDYLGARSTDVQGVLNNIALAITKLTNIGARNIMVPNLPNLGITPLATSLGPEAAQGLTQLSAAHNAGLATLIETLDRNPAVNIIPVDVEGLINQAVTNPADFGFTNVRDPLLVQPSNNPSQYLFWDDLHPTTAAHSFVGDRALRATTALGEVVSIEQARSAR